MKEYEINQIFTDDEDYSNKAQWCNENGCYIEEIEPKVETVDNEEVTTRQFQIKDTVDYYYIKELSSTKQLVEYTTNRRVAYDGDYLEATNTYKVSDVETSEKDGKLYLKGYAPKKTTEEYFNEFKSNLRTSVKNEFEKVAQEKGFSGSVECTSYAMASNSQRKTWALIYLAWRDKANIWYDDWIDNKLKLQAKVPNLEEVLAEMPQINWNAKLTDL